MASPSPKSPELSEKNKQYDRQLRLWGDHGQVALEKGQVCLINANALGTETLKSLILPGIGSVTIVDKNIVTEEDIGSNFFLEASSIGQSRGSEALQYLLELNPAVHGEAVEETPEKLLRDNPDFFKSFDVVVASNIREKTIQKLSQVLWDLNIPFIMCRSLGFLGAFRIQIREHCVVETHPDNEQPDLRLDAPFPALKEYFDSFKLEELDLKDHAHIPWPIVLYKALEDWRSKNKRLPQSRKDKDQIRETIREWIRKDENGVPIDEENFEEAIRAVNTALAPLFVPAHVKELFNNTNTINLHKNSLPFWIMCSALKAFVDKEGTLPVKGNIPDMTATTDHYITLQNIYKTKSTNDAETMYRNVQNIVMQLKRDIIPESDVKLFCRYSTDLYYLNGTPMMQEYENGTPAASYICKQLEEPDKMMVHYIMLRGVEKFMSEYTRYPGDFDPEQDISALRNCVNAVLKEFSCSPFPKDDHIQEMCRYGGAEIHSVSAFMAGCISQEVVKLITKQYKPVNNFFIHDAASTDSATFTF